VRWTATGTYAGGFRGAKAHPGTTVSFTGTDTLCIKDGKFVEYWRKLRHPPAPRSAPRCKRHPRAAPPPSPTASPARARGAAWQAAVHSIPVDQMKGTVVWPGSAESSVDNHVCTWRAAYTIEGSGTGSSNGRRDRVARREQFLEANTMIYRAVAKGGGEGEPVDDRRNEVNARGGEAPVLVSREGGSGGRGSVWLYSSWW
jgi:hypothetical protein